MDRGPIHVTKAFVPPVAEYQALVAEIFDSGVFTNYGPFVKLLESQLSSHLGLPDTIFLGNGTIALQLAIKALGIKGEVITTPYSYVATTSSILWEGCRPVFVDINEDDYCIDAELIEERINDRTTAILATHVYGVPCDVDRIQTIADKYGLAVIYDGAHAFGSVHKGRPLLAYGDISTTSFHSTKLFHTVEGGAVFTSDIDLQDKLRLMRSFGHRGDDHVSLGVNAKNSEFHAAMGICNLRYIDEILSRRRHQWLRYENALKGKGPSVLRIPDDTEFGHAYFPMDFESFDQMSSILKALGTIDVHPRRYFYPSLNTLPYLENSEKCPISESVAEKVLCAPLYHDLNDESIDMICAAILKTIQQG